MKESIVDELKKALDEKRLQMLKDGSVPIEEMYLLLLGSIATSLAVIADDVCKDAEGEEE